MNHNAWRLSLVALGCAALALAAAHVAVRYAHGRSQRYVLHKSGLIRLDQHSGAVDVVRDNTWHRVGEEADQILALQERVQELERQLARERQNQQEVQAQLEAKDSELRQVENWRKNLSDSFGSLHDLALQRARNGAERLAQDGRDKQFIVAQLIQCSPLSDLELRSIATLITGLPTPWCVFTYADRPALVSIRPSDYADGTKIGCGRTEKELDAIVERHHASLKKAGVQHGFLIEDLQLHEAAGAVDSPAQVTAPRGNEGHSESPALPQ